MIGQVKTGSMEISITQASPADASEILALQKIAYRSEALLYEDWTIPPLTQTLSQIEEEFESRVFLKAVLEDTIVGSVRASLDGGTCLVGRLIVDPDFRRKGIGAELMRRIGSYFPDAHRFELFTGKRSQDNIRLYRGLGYRVFREEDLSPKVRLVFLEKINDGRPRAEGGTGE